MTDISNRSRVSSGVPTGGEFATETKGENPDLTTGVSDAETAEALQGAYESAATACSDMYGDVSWDVDANGIPMVFKKVHGDPTTLKVNQNRAVGSMEYGEIAQAAVDDINEYFGPEFHSDGYDGPVVTATRDDDMASQVHLAVSERETHDCDECGAIMHTGTCEDDADCPGMVGTRDHNPGCSAA